MKGAGDGNENPDLQKLQEIKKNFDTMGAGRKIQRVGMTTSICRGAPPTLWREGLNSRSRRLK